MIDILFDKKMAPVLALTIIDADTLDKDYNINGNTKLLIGIRNSNTHITHPNVVSVPTQRIPFQLFEFIVNNSNFIESVPPKSNFSEQAKQTFILDSKNIDSRKVNGHNPIIYCIESLLTSKLGLAEPLENNDIWYIGFPCALFTGATLYEKIDNCINAEKIEMCGEELYKEYISMLNIAVILSNIDYLPKNTVSFTQFRWIDVHTYIELIEKKNSNILLNLFGNQVSICARGLCLLSTYIYLKEQYH